MANQAPLAERMRPRNAEEIVGQAHLIQPGKPLYRALNGEYLHSMVLWGPPGCGKTTIARLLSRNDKVEYISLSAVTSGIKDIRDAISIAKQNQLQHQSTLLFIDEVHRFNKTQQDAFLPHIEDGTIIFVGATTENPSFELNRALLSRVPVYSLQALDEKNISHALTIALTDAERGLNCSADYFTDAALNQIIYASHGDLRRALGLLENIVSNTRQADTPIELSTVESLLSEALSGFDKGGDQFYDLISALHKSVRGSDPDAACYWAMRILRGGADAHYVLRRLVRIASEDIGNADPRALQITLNAWEAYDKLGEAEGELAIFQALIYLSVAAKSNAVYMAEKKTRALVNDYPHSSVPLHLRNAPTALARREGHGKHYRYAHNEPHHYSAGENYWPEDIRQRENLYSPCEQGLEKKIQAKLEWLSSLDKDYLKK